MVEDETINLQFKMSLSTRNYIRSDTYDQKKKFF